MEGGGGGSGLPPTRSEGQPKTTVHHDEPSVVRSPQVLYNGTVSDWDQTFRLARKLGVSLTVEDAQVQDEQWTWDGNFRSKHV